MWSQNEGTLLHLHWDKYNYPCDNRWLMECWCFTCSTIMFCLWEILGSCFNTILSREKQLKHQIFFIWLYHINKVVKMRRYIFQHMPDALAGLVEVIAFICLMCLPYLNNVCFFYWKIAFILFYFKFQCSAAPEVGWHTLVTNCCIKCLFLHLEW